MNRVCGSGGGGSPPPRLLDQVGKRAGVAVALGALVEIPDTLNNPRRRPVLFVRHGHSGHLVGAVD